MPHGLNNKSNHTIKYGTSVLETSVPLLKDNNEHMLEFLLGGVDFCLDKNVSDSFSNIKHIKRDSKLSNDSKRRSKGADNQKARPRDRQLIQDRLKELRDLVRDGVKCSIDGLLDRTIHHMMFLRSVTDKIS
ncbi:hypothetical protein POM88_027528 [Heracleum sosnowskyi]|uniref:BHLH domain-containing protein n=1 Tax=Heracleum sosnowskyi TaxID=360622 RepID=A0AAD8I7Z2_9APIA|nr:hypothetical protein POM88_027528 [Heracleum sosnowskyi]